MKGAARVKTSFKLRGTSKGEGKGLCFRFERRYEECLDSTVKMEPAAVR